MSRIEVVHGPALQKGESTTGIMRAKAFESDNVLFGRSKIAGGAKSAWHHHAEHDLYGFLVSGTLRVEYGENGRDSVEISPGDFFHIPAGVVHRDVNPERDREATVVHLLLGEGPTVVNVSEP